MMSDLQKAVMFAVFGFVSIMMSLVTKIVLLQYTSLGFAMIFFMIAIILHGRIKEDVKQ